jgi:hypothetical protein
VRVRTQEVRKSLSQAFLCQSHALENRFLSPSRRDLAFSSQGPGALITPTQPSGRVKEKGSPCSNQARRGREGRKVGPLALRPEENHEPLLQTHTRPRAQSPGPQGGGWVKQPILPPELHSGRLWEPWKN